MTKTVCVTDLREIKGLKVVCLSCGASFSFPVGRKNIPERCICCNRDIPSTGVGRILAEIDTVVRQATSPAYGLDKDRSGVVPPGFVVYIETEKE